MRLFRRRQGWVSFLLIFQITAHTHRTTSIHFGLCLPAAVWGFFSIDFNWAPFFVTGPHPRSELAHTIPLSIVCSAPSTNHVGDDDCVCCCSWRYDVLIAFGTLSSFLASLTQLVKLFALVVLLTGDENWKIHVDLLSLVWCPTLCDSLFLSTHAVLSSKTISSLPLRPPPPPPTSISFFFCAYHRMMMIAFITDDDDFFYYHSWRNNVVIAFETLSSFLT